MRKIIQNYSMLIFPILLWKKHEGGLAMHANNVYGEQYEQYQKANSIELGIKEEWIDKKEITIMPYLNSNSPDEGTSKKTKVEKFKFPIVIERYKMSGLNEDGSDIADDMCFGEKEKMSRPIYKSALVKKYIEEYKEGGFDETKHKNFSNENEYEYDDNGNYIYSKAIYDISENPIGKYWLLDYSDDKLFEIFRKMATEIFTDSDDTMQKNINAMIDKFQNDEGGIYEFEDLPTELIETHPSTVRYCNELEKYIKRKLNENNGNILKLEDKEVDFRFKGENPLVTRKRDKDKDFSLTPVYDGGLSSLEKLGNIINGFGIALGDIWATEVMITEYNKLNESEYSVKYQVTLWDHFGLDVKDIAREKDLTIYEGFYAWFHLQHYRGYRPFITKITFKNFFKGNLKDEIK
jgi:hypothetical protein